MTYIRSLARNFKLLNGIVMNKASIIFHKKSKRTRPYACNFSEDFQIDQLIFHVFSPFIINICEHFRCFREGHFGMIQIMVT